MADKLINTRIALRVDTFENWQNASKLNQGANLVLKRGEIGFCEIPSGSDEATTAPTVLFKVGDGTTPFSGLKWGSALAADVHGWAKSETVILVETEIKDGEGKVTGKKQELQFKTGATVNHVVDLSSFATDEEVATLTSTLDARIAAVEAVIGTDSGDAGSVSAQLADHEERITANTGKLAGIDTTVVAAIEASEATTKTAYEAADEIINKKLGNDFTETNTVAKAIDDITKADGTIDTKVKALADGAVATNASNISKVAGDLETAIETLTEADGALNDRLELIEAFFGTADKDGIDTTPDKTVYDALDTLKEIQDYIKSDGEAAADMLDAIDANAEAIEALQKEFTTTEGAKGRVVAAEEAIDDLNAAISRIDGEIDGHDTKIENLETFKDATVPSTYETIANVDLVRTDVSNLKTLTTGDNGNAKLREDLSALDTRVSTAEGTLATTTTIANNASATATANAGRLDVLEGRFGDDILVFYCGTSTEVI